MTKYLLLALVALPCLAAEPDAVGNWLQNAQPTRTQDVMRAWSYARSQQQRLAAADWAVARAVGTNVCARYMLTLQTPPVEARQKFGQELAKATDLKTVAQILRDRDDYWRWRDMALKRQITPDEVKKALGK